MSRIIVPKDIARACRFDPERNRRILQRELNQLILEDCRRRGAPLPIVGGTLFSGSETLASLSVASAAVANSVAEASLLPRDAVGPFAPSYWGNPRSCLRLTAYGIISTTLTPTILFKVKQNTAYANPVAGAILCGSNANAALTTGSGLANANWLVDVLMQVRATGQAGTILAVGRLHSSIVSATDTLRFMSNANPPTAVSEDLTLNQFLDLTATWGTASASNTLQCLAYLLESLF